MSIYIGDTVSAVVCKEHSTYATEYGRIKKTARMKLIGPAPNTNVWCWKYITPSNTYPNTYGSAIFGRPIIGNIIICSPDGVDIDQINVLYNNAGMVNRWVTVARGLNRENKKINTKKAKNKYKNYEMATVSENDMTINFRQMNLNDATDTKYQLQMNQRKPIYDKQPRQINQQTLYYNNLHDMDYMNHHDADVDMYDDNNAISSNYNDY